MTGKIENQTKNQETNTTKLDKITKTHVIDDYGGLSRKIPKLKLLMTSNIIKLCAFKNKNKIININASDAIVNDSTSLEILLSMLEKEANKLAIKSFQLCNEDQIFKYFTTSKFKETAEQILKEITIILVKAPLIITDDKTKIELITKFHDDEILGGHFGS